MSEKPTLLIVATYANQADADADYDALMAAHKGGDLGHLAVGMVSKDADGKVTLHRHDTTAKHLAWVGAGLGAALVILAPPVGLSLLAAGGAVVGAGIGGVVGHYWKGIPKKDLNELGDALDNSTVGLVAVAVDKKAEEIDFILAKAQRKIQKRLDKGDVEGAYETAVKTASLLSGADASTATAAGDSGPTG